MGADYDNMLAKLQIQLAQQDGQGPSLFGLQAQTDPNTMAALASKLQQQQYVNSVGNTPGPYGYLHDAGAKDFARAGQSLAGLLGIGQPKQYDNSNVMAQRAAIQDGKTQLSQSLAQPGADPNQVQIQVLTKLAQSGVPGAADALEKAQTSMLKNAQTQAETRKANSQADLDTSSIGNQADEAKNRAFQQGSGTWQTTYTDPSGFYMLQQNKNGETRRVELKPTAQNAQPLDPDQVARIAQGIKDGRIPAFTGAAAKTPIGLAVTTQLAADPTYDGTTYPTKAKALVAFATGPEGKAVTSFNVAQTHLDTLQQAAAALNNGTLPAANKFLNMLGVQGGGTAQAAFDATKNVVANEIVKTIVPGQSAVGDREEVQKEITSAQTPQQLQAVISKYQELMSGKLSGLRQQYESSTGLKNFESKLSKRSIELAHQSASYTGQFPNPNDPSAQTPQGGPGKSPSAPPAALPPTNANGWTLHKDAKGNQAYVSPDGKQFQQVQ